MELGRWPQPRAVPPSIDAPRAPGRVRAAPDRDQGGKARARSQGGCSVPGSRPPGCAWATLGDPLGVDWGGPVLGTGWGDQRTSGSRCESWRGGVLVGPVGGRPGPSRLFTQQRLPVVSQRVGEQIGLRVLPRT